MWNRSEPHAVPPPPPSGPGPTRRRRLGGAASAALRLLAVAALLGREPASAQEGTRLRPSLSVVEVHDDNLFFTPEDRVADMYTRVTPGLQLTHRSAPAVFSLRYDVDIDFFARQLDLNDRKARQEGVVNLDANAGILGYSGQAGYTQTQSPRELNIDTGVGAGRIEAERWATRQLLTLHLGALNSAILEYDFSRDAIVDEPPIDVHSGRLGLERRVTPRDSVRISYVLRRYLFRMTGQDVTAHLVLLGWTRELTPRTRMEVFAGPRFAEALKPEMGVTLRHRFHLGEVSLLYSQTQNTILGLPGTVTTDHAAVGFARQLHPRLRVVLTPSYFRNRNPALDMKVYQGAVDAEWRMTRWLDLDASYRGALQHGGVFAFPFADIAQNVVMVRLKASTR